WRRSPSGDVGVGTDGECALVVVLVPIENHIHAMVLEELCGRAHLIIPDRSIPGRKRRLVKHHEFPRLRTGIKIVNQPIAKHRRIWRKGELRGRGYGWPVEHPIKQVRVGVQKNEVGAAGVEREIVHVVDLLLGALAGVNRCGSAVSSDSRGGSVRRALETEDYPVGRDG